MGAGGKYAGGGVSTGALFTATFGAVLGSKEKNQTLQNNFFNRFMF